MFPFTRAKCFASVLLIVIVLFHILICVDAGWKFKFGGGRARPIGRPRVRPMGRPIVRPIIRTPVIKLGSVPPKIQARPPVKPSLLKGPVVHQPFGPRITRPPVISPKLLQPKPPPISGEKIGSSNLLHAEGGGRVKPVTNVNTNHLPGPVPAKPLPIKPTAPLKPTSSAMVLYKRPQVSSVKPGSSNAGSSSSQSSSSATQQLIVSKPTAPLKSPSPQLFRMISPKPLSGASGSIYPAWANPYLKPQASGSGSVHSSSSSSLATKPMTSSSSLTPYKLTQNRPIQGAIIKQQTSSLVSSSPHVTSAVKPQMNSKPLTPYQGTSHSTSGSSSLIKLNGVKPLKQQTSGLVSSSPHVTSAVKPQMNSKPLTPYQGTSHSISGSSSHIKLNEVKPGSSTISHGHPHHKPLPQTPSTANHGSTGSLTTSHGHPHYKPLPQTPSTANHGSTGSLTTSHGHPHYKPLPQTPSTANQGSISTSSHHVSPVNEPAISTSHASSVMSSANSHPHHEIPAAPITSTSQIQSSYPGANQPTNAASYVPNPPVQVVNMITNTGPAQSAVPQMGHYGGSGMGSNGGSGMNGLGGMVAEAVIHNVVNHGIHRIFNNHESSNFNYATVPIDPNAYQQPQYPGAAPSAPAQGTTTVHNNYYVDPNAANVQGQATSVQDQTQVQSGPTSESGSSPGNYGSYQNPMSAGNLPPSDPQIGNLPPSDDQIGNLPPSDDQIGNLPPSDDQSGNLPASDVQTGNLPPSDDQIPNLPPSDDHIGNLPPGDDQIPNLPPGDDQIPNLPPSDDQIGNLPPSDDQIGNLPPSDDQIGNLPPSDDQIGDQPPSDDQIENLPPSDDQIGNLPLSDDQIGNLPEADDQIGNLPPGDEQTINEPVPVDNSELWELTETIFGYETNISQYINLDLQASEFDSVASIEATKPLLNVQEEAKLLPTIKAVTDLFDNYEYDPTKVENVDTEQEDALLDEFLKTEAIIGVMEFLEERKYIAPNQRKETLQQLWMRRYENTMSGFERIFLAERSSDDHVFGGQNWIYFDHHEQSKRIKYINYQNSFNLADVAQLLKVNYQFDNVDQKGKAMLIGTSPHLEMALYTVCHYVRWNTWCTVSLANKKFGIYTHSWLYDGQETLDVGTIDF